MDVIDSVAASRQRVVGFADVVRIPLRRWGTVLIATGAATFLVLVYLFLFPATYRATAVVVLRPVVTDPFTLPSSGADRAINMTAENGIALGNDVVDTTARILNRDSEEIREALTTEVPTGGQVLRFQYAADTEQNAITGANTAAQTYLRVREDIYKQQRAALILSYVNTIKSVTAQRQEAQRALPEEWSSRDSASPRTQATLDQVSKLNDQIAQLANARAKVASADLSPGSIAAAARSPIPSSRDAALILLAAALLGGMLSGVVAAHAREALDRRIRSIEQAADLVGMPSLGVVRSGQDAVAAADARYVSLAMLKWIERRPDHALVVLSGSDDEGRTSVSGNLAVALAQAGHDVTLVGTMESHDELKEILLAAQKRTPPRLRTLSPPKSASLNGSHSVDRNTYSAPFTSHAAGVSTPSGASMRLAESPLRAQTSSRDADVTMLIDASSLRQTAEAAPASTSGTMAARRLLTVLVGEGAVRLCPLGEEPDAGVVVIDGPPSDTDERGVRAAQDGIAILVVGCDRTRNTDLSRLVDRLRSAGAQTAGFVLTGGRGA